MKSKTNILKRIILMLLTCMLITGTMTVTASAATVKLNKSKITLNVKKTYQLKLSGTSKKVKWSTSNKKVAAVSSKGKVTAKKKGTATITAKVGKKAYKCKVTVKQPVTSVKLNKKSATLKKKGAAVTLKATASPKTANNRTVKWTTSDKNVATVSSKGKVTAVGNGTCTITATAKDGSGKKATCAVTVNITNSSKVTYSYSLEVEKDSVSMYDDGTATMKVTMTTKPSNAAGYKSVIPNQNVTWSSADTKVATVRNGVISGVAKGSTTVTGSYNGMTVTVNVSVNCRHNMVDDKKQVQKIDYTKPEWTYKDNFTSCCLTCGRVFRSSEETSQHLDNALCTIERLYETMGLTYDNTKTAYQNLKTNFSGTIDESLNNPSVTKFTWIIYNTRSGSICKYADLASGENGKWSTTPWSYSVNPMNSVYNFSSKVNGFKDLLQNHPNTTYFPTAAGNEAYNIITCTCGASFTATTARNGHSAYDNWLIHAECHKLMGFTNHKAIDAYTAGIVEKNDRTYWDEEVVGQHCTKCGYKNY